MDNLLPPTGTPLLKASTGSADTLSPSRTLPHVRIAPSATVEQEEPDTARRPSGDSTTSGQINRSIIPLKAEESQLSSSRTGSEPPAPLGLWQRPSGAARALSGHFSPVSDGDTRSGSVGPDSSGAPGAQRSLSSTLPAPQIPPSAFDPKLEYSTEQVVLFWQPPNCFSQRSPSPFVVDNVSYSCAEQYMRAEKARLFQDRRAEELNMSSPDPTAHKRIGRGVSNFDNAVWDRVREDSVLAGNLAKFSQNPTVKYHLLSTGSKSLAEASPFDPVWGIGLRADDPEARDPRLWRGKN